MKLVLYVILLLINISAYGQENSFITHEGIKYTLFRNNQNLPLPKIGDYIRMKLIKYNPNGKEVFNTDFFGDPYGVEVELTSPKYAGDVMEIFALISNGDSAYVYVPCAMAEPSGSCSDSSYFFYKIYLNLIYPKDIYFAIKEDLKNNVLRNDSIEIASYLHQHKVRKYYRDSSGVVVIKRKKIKPISYPKYSRNICIHYRGQLLSGKSFDDSYSRGEPLCITTFTHSVIEGWDIGLRYFNTGEKGKLLIPSTYGYGDKGNGNDIPPNAILYFDIEVLE
jgi:hypothetical protein